MIVKANYLRVKLSKYNNTKIQENMTQDNFNNLNNKTNN